MSDPVRAIDSSPMAKIFSAILEEGPAFVGKMVGKTFEIASAAADSVGSVFGSVKDTAVGAFHSAPSASKEVAVARAPAQEAAKPTLDLGPQADKYTVSMADLGNLAPPAVGSIGHSNGGMGVG